MELSFALVLMIVFTVFQMWRLLQAMYDLVFGYGRSIEQYDAMEVIGQIGMMCVASAAIYFLIKLLT